jgi:hypothetical protein
MGLYTAMDVVERAGGHMAVESRATGGTAVTVSLPRQRPGDDAPPAQPRPPLPDIPVFTAAKKKRPDSGPV